MATANSFNTKPNSPSKARVKIAIVPYNPKWPEWFTQEAAKLQAALDDELKAIYHVGSTAVPGLAAKTDIDITLVIGNLQAALSLQALGYTFKGELNIPLRYFFSKNTDGTKVNLHVCEENHGFISLNLAFRDWLRTHEEDRKAYEAVKYALLEDPEVGTRVRGAFTTYSLGKDDVIKNIIRKSGYTGTIVKFCLHDREWAAAKYYRTTYFLESPDLEPDVWRFNDECHKHLVLYKGAIIVGYAHVELWPEQRSVIRGMMIAAAARGNRYGKAFLFFIEQWLRYNGYKYVCTQGVPELVAFYEHFGYTRTPCSGTEDGTTTPTHLGLHKVL